MPTENTPPKNTLPVTSISSKPPSVIPKYIRNKTTLHPIKDGIILNHCSFKQFINDIKGNKTFNLDPSGLQQAFTKGLNKLNLTEHLCLASVFENKLKSMNPNQKEDAKYSGYSLVKPRVESPTNATYLTIV